MSDWQDGLAAHRMAADRAFAERVRDSELTSQQWSVAMTAVSFDVTGAEDPETATLVADTSRVADVMSELERAGSRGPVAGGERETEDREGFLDRVRSALGGDGDPARRETVDRLANEYASVLEDELRTSGAWTDVCRAAAESERS